MRNISNSKSVVEINNYYVVYTNLTKLNVKENLYYKCNECIFHADDDPNGFPICGLPSYLFGNVCDGLFISINSRFVTSRDNELMKVVINYFSYLNSGKDYKDTKFDHSIMDETGYNDLVKILSSSKSNDPDELKLTEDQLALMTIITVLDLKNESIRYMYYNSLNDEQKKIVSEDQYDSLYNMITINY
jgi:hypothetical protein